MNENPKQNSQNNNNPNNTRSTSGAANASSSAANTGTNFNYQTDNQFCGIASWLLTLSPLEFAALSTTLGLLLSLGLNMDEAQRLGVFLGSTAYTMITYSSQANFLADKIESKQAEVEYEDLMKVINQLQNEVIKLKSQHERNSREEKNKESGSKEQ